ncbi:tetratricopeptide repeat protein [Kribbella sp. DT2]|uniref:tetratricopeptide repeat protein n=1 Tax=Kribbella sp. DT2 TaxID=3393427 RepID=UPI003CED42A1
MEGTIRLLGRPSITYDGVPVRSPRGRKSWALLAYVLLAERPPTRKRLAELLFADAEDPLGALRWTLAELRRALGVRGALCGDPVMSSLAGVLGVDVLQVLDAGGAAAGLASADPRRLLEIEGELLEGLELEACPDFESWLLIERQRIASAVEARLREAAVGLVAAGRARDAIPFASKAVAANPLEQGNHELLVRSLAVSGDRPAALRQVAVCEDLLRRELGIEASAALRQASAVDRGPALSVVGSRATALSAFEAGRAAVAAGVVESGLECLRRAVSEAARCADAQLQGRALVALGGALVHAIRGRDEEGAITLQEAILVAERAEDRATVVTAYRELGFVEVQAGRRATAETWLAKAAGLAVGSADTAAILGVRGMNSSDLGDYPAALRQLVQSTELAAECGDARQQAWSLSILGRAQLLRGDYSQARTAVAQSLDLVRQQRWVAFLPWPQALQAELDLHAGEVGAAGEGFEQAWALACQVNDPCWEGIAARGLGLLAAERGDYQGVVHWLDQAARRASREPDRYQWVHAHVLDTAARTALDQGDHVRARPLVAQLAALAARCDMRELVVRAQLHLGRLGDPHAIKSARLLAAGIDNPELAKLVEGHRPSWPSSSKQPWVVDDEIVPRWRDAGARPPPESPTTSGDPRLLGDQQRLSPDRRSRRSVAPTRGSGRSESRG